MRIAPALLEEMIEHARRDAPNECCGAVGVRDGAAASIYPCRNVAESPLRFEMGIDLFHALEAMDAAGEELGAIYHSHPKTEPYPSQTDVNWSGQYPGAQWVIVGLDGGRGEAVVRSFTIDDAGRVFEAPLEPA